LGLALDQFADFGFHQLLVEQLAAGDAVDLTAQRRNTVFVGLLHARLPRRGRADEVVAQHQIGGCEKVAHRNGGERRAGQACNPWTQGEVPDFIASGDDDGVRLLALAEYRGLSGWFHGNEAFIYPTDVVRLHIVKVNKALP